MEVSVVPSMRELQRQRTRDAILKAAAEEFDARGYAAVSLSEIAARVEVTKGSVYFHFPSKADLAAAVVSTYSAAWQTIVDGVDAIGHEGIAALRQLSAEAARVYRDDAGVRAPLRLMREQSVIGVELPTPFRPWLDAVARQLAIAQEQGEVRVDVEPETVAWHIVACFFGTQEISHQLNNRSDLVERTDAMWDLILQGITT